MTDLLAQVVAAQDRRLLDLYDLKVTVDGPATPDVCQVADQLRAMIVSIEPELQALVVGPHGNRRQRRTAAARQRSRA